MTPRRAGPFARLAVRWASLGADFAIVARPGRATLTRGRIPRSQLGAIDTFFNRDLRSDCPVTVRGSWSGDGRLTLRIRGRLDPGRRQRVRNFLLERLGR